MHRAPRAPQRLRGGAQQRITRSVAELVVDEFETIEVDEDDSNALPAGWLAAALLDGVQGGKSRGAIQTTGQVIDARLALELLAHRDVFRGVGHTSDESGDAGTLVESAVAR